MKSKRYYTNLILIITLVCVFFGFLLNISFRNRERFRLDLSRGSITTLKSKTIDVLKKLGAPVKITYFVTEKKRMPTLMKDVEENARALLREMASRGGKNFSYEVINPEDKPQVARNLGRFKISSFQFKSVLKDEYSVNTVWSGMLVEYKGEARPVPYITSEHLPFLETKLIALLDNIEHGYKPKIAINAKYGYETFSKTVNDLGVAEVVPFEFGRERLPQYADMAFIVEPKSLAKEDVEDIKNFMRDGRDVFFAHSNYEILPSPDGLKLSYKPCGIEEFLGDIGVKQEHKAILEEKDYMGAPYWLRVMAMQVNLDGYRLQRTGTLFIPFASPLSVDVPKLRKNGYFSDTLIFSSKQSWGLAFSEGDTILMPSSFSPPKDKNTKVESAAIVLVSERPWEGRFFFFSSGKIFSDWACQNGANALYLKNNLMTFALPEKFTSLGISREVKPVIKPVSFTERFFWRIACVLIIPAVIVVLLFLKVLKVQYLNVALRSFDVKFALLFAGIALALFLLIFGLNLLGIEGIDISENSANTLNRKTRDYLKAMSGSIEIKYYSSPVSQMPLNARDMSKNVLDKLREFEKASRGKVKVSCTLVDGADEELKARLNEDRIKPNKMVMIENDKYVEKMVYSALVFSDAGKREVMPFLTVKNSERLEFVVVSALERLTTGRRPSIAFFADLPHLTAGEFWELQQLEVQTLPRSEDVYRRLIEILRNDGYELNVYDSKSNAEPREDMLIYIQPWVVEDHMKKVVNRYLIDGKSVVLAAEHFVMQIRKYSGRGYDLAYWPQNQFSRINELTRPYGIELVEEIFLDESKAPIETREQIRWGAYRKQDKRSPDARPFLIKALAQNFAQNSSITGGLSDLLFIYANRWRKVPGAFSRDLKWIPLISSTGDSWAYDWQGGFLTEDNLLGKNYLDIPQPLSVVADGKFDAKYGNSADEGGADGKMVLIGSSKMFDNEQIDTTRYDNEKFILNVFGTLGYGDDFAVMQNSGKRKAYGISFVDPARKMLWRFIATFFIPILFIFYGFKRARRA